MAKVTPAESRGSQVGAGRARSSPLATCVPLMMKIQHNEAIAMMDWTCSPNENNLLQISIYFSFSLAGPCITAPCYTEDRETSPRDPKARPGGGLIFMLCNPVYHEMLLLVVLKSARAPPALYLIRRLVCAASTESPWTLIWEGLAGRLVVALRV